MSSADALRYLVCYDIPDTPRRDKIARKLDDYGARVQYSVFEMVLDHRLFDNLVADLNALIDPAQDRVNVYALCAACMKKALFLGLSETDERPGSEIVFIV